MGDVQTHTTDAAAVAAEPATLDRGGYSVYVKPKPTVAPVGEGGQVHLRQVEPAVRGARPR